MSTGFPIIDAHQHFWDPSSNYHPWLCDEPPIPFRYGDYRSIRRPYLPADYFVDAAGFDVVGTVYVETEWNPADPIGETRWAEALRRETGFPTVVVAQAWLDRPDCASVLEAQASVDCVRSVRHKPRANPSPHDGRPGGMTDSAWRAGFARLAPLGLRSTCRPPGGISRRRRAWRPISPAPRSSSTMPACLPTAVQAAWPPGARRVHASPSVRTCR